MTPPQTSDLAPEQHKTTARAGSAARPGSAVLDDLPLIGCVVVVTAGPWRGELSSLFTRRGAKVVETSALAFGLVSPDHAALERLIDMIVRRDVHAVTFSSAVDASAMMDAAGTNGMRGELLAALRTDVTVVCADPVCARPLELLGLVPLRPDRARPGAMVSTLCTGLPSRIRREVSLPDGRALVLQGFAAVIDNTPSLLPPLPAAVLAELARQPGWVVSRADLLRRVWAARGAGTEKRDEHAVEATVARLRAALGPNAALIKTVTKRGYRLAVEGEVW